MKSFTMFVAAAAFALAATAAEAAAPTVTIDSGTVAGTSDGNIDSFKGIPYAAPPTGPMRWMPPALPAPWTGTRQATAYGPICPQPPRGDGVVAAGYGSNQSEDCLSINVWAPHGAKHAPVMFWIHGGAHRLGSSAGPIYDGTEFARDGVVLVSINYRLGILGYFAHPALTKAAAPDAPLGNYGQMDQIAALNWVKRNIAAFGGDPDNVTVFGESAGGSSILYLMSAPSAKGLFARAIVESGGGWFQSTSLAQKENEGAEFATRQGLPGANATLEQLRAIPVEKTFDIPLALGFGPFADGRLIPMSPTKAFATGTEAHVPLIVGSNSFEASLLKTFTIPPERILGRLSPDTRKLFADGTTSDQEIAQNVFTDSVMGGPAHWIAVKQSAVAPTYLYHFSYVTQFRRGKVPGAGHGTEIPYVFSTGGALMGRMGIPMAPQDTAMSHLMHSCWVGFAKTGKPACDGADWPAYSAGSDTLMEFGDSSGPVSGFHKAQYRALESVLMP